ncbi:MAG: adenine deaminase [Methanomicrobiales archaeon]|nr:adenine deaminase [Methanomicrobiales archaeon]
MVVVDFVKKETLIPVSRGEIPADTLFSQVDLYNPFTLGWDETNIAVYRGIVVGLGDYQGREEVNLKGKRVVPGLIDAHVHIESSLLTPHEYARLVSRHGTSTVIADPHEIANVLGTTGLSYMLESRKGLPIDIFFMLPSCVPATPLDLGGVVLSAGDLSTFIRHEGVVGLGEMMNVPAVLNKDPDVWAKLSLCSVIDGHAPQLSGKDLNAYILAGPSSDHECTRIEEAREKLALGMYLFLREGSTEHNVALLSPLLTTATAPRCAFATDDAHADMLARMGHIDHAVRVAMDAGVEMEVALRSATLSAAERFGLHDRGALVPGRVADFAVLSDGKPFAVEATYHRGLLASKIRPPTLPIPRNNFDARAPVLKEIAFMGKGTARVIGIVPHQIITTDLRYIIGSENELPDLERDLLKVVVCNRYRPSPCGVGIVHGFGLNEGALGASISHDAHNIVVVGTSDHEILTAIKGIIRVSGAIIAIGGGRTTILPLPVAGLMSDQPYETVIESLDTISGHAHDLGAVKDPFMYLSFLALSVIPALRITDRGLFDVGSFRDVPVIIEDTGN